MNPAAAGLSVAAQPGAAATDRQHKDVPDSQGQGISFQDRDAALMLARLK
jgi:hypothetical protein